MSQVKLIDGILVMCLKGSSNPTSFKLIVQSKAQIKYAALYRILLRLETKSNISDNSSKSAKKVRAKELTKTQRPISSDRRK